MDPQTYTGELRELATEIRRNRADIQELQDTVDGLALSSLDGVNFASDSGAERAAAMVAAREITPAQVHGIVEGSGKDGAITVADLEGLVQEGDEGGD